MQRVQTQQAWNLSELLAAINECSTTKNIERGKALHKQLIEHGLNTNRYVAGSLLNMYAKCGHMIEARNIFDKIPERDVVTWTTLTLGYAENGQEHLALDAFSLMQQRGCSPNAVTYVAALKACTSLASKPSRLQVSPIETGARIHSDSISRGLYSDTIANTLVAMYSKWVSIERAREVFHKMPVHSIVSWNAMILAYAENGEPETALEFFTRMLDQGLVPDARTFVSVLKSCSVAAEKEEAKEVDGKPMKLKALDKAKSIHTRVHAPTDTYVSSLLIDLYAKCGSMVDAWRVFERMPAQDIVSLNALLQGYAENGEAELVLSLFNRFSSRAMARTFTAPLKACVDLAMKEPGRTIDGKHVKLNSLAQGMKLHSLAAHRGFDGDPFVASILVHMYGKCGSMFDARTVFDRMEGHSVVTWNSLVLGYVENGDALMALEAFQYSVPPNATTFLAVLKACTTLAGEEQSDKTEALRRGRDIHSRALEAGFGSEIYVANSLVDMYATCGSLTDAAVVFKGMNIRTVVSYNALMLAYAESKQGQETLRLFTQMPLDGVQPNALSFLAATKASGSLVSLEISKALETEMRRIGFENEALLEASLVDAYGKCGSMSDAQHAFDAHGTRDLVAFTALMVGYSRHGESDRVFELFEVMNEEGLSADSVSFLCIFTACSHVGLVERGKQLFDTMKTDYGVQPDVDHYTCMVDVLGRGNRLEDAVSMLDNMPVKPTSVTWMTLLAASRKWKNVGVGTLAFEKLIQFDEKDASAYVLMSNIYGAAGMWDEQARVVNMRDSVKAWKVPGQSWWTDDKGTVHAFMSGGGDEVHPQMIEIHTKLKEIVVKMKEQGYVADLGCVLSDMPEEDKEDALCEHSERLAIACALINTQPGRMIRIVKNLRVCDDCHQATAIISKVEQRTIVCRDANRFHVFSAGKCSCRDFW